MKDRKPASCSENIFLILTLYESKIKTEEKNGVTNFPYFLHSGFDGFTARKLLDYGNYSTNPLRDKTKVLTGQ